MPPSAKTRRPRSAPAGTTGQEALYLRFLSEKQVPVQVKLRDGEVVGGWIEYFDDCMVRLTREGKPNLFIYKQQIRTISELVRKEESKRRAAGRKQARTQEKTGDTSKVQELATHEDSPAAIPASQPGATL